jgi:hypothetical protein
MPSKKLPKKPLATPKLPGRRKNEFGDPADTLYAGGTPLFDEGAGRAIDKRPMAKPTRPKGKG